MFRRSLLLNNSNDSERLSIELPVKFYTQVYQRLDGSLRCFSYVLNVVKATSIFEKVKRLTWTLSTADTTGWEAVKRHFLTLLA